MKNSKIIVKTNLTHFANRIISIPGMQEAKFNANCEIEVNEEDVENLLNSGLGFSIVGKKSDKDIDPLTEKDDDTTKTVELTEEEKKVAEEEQQKEDQKQYILSLKTKSQLVKLAEDFPKEEWDKFKDVDKFKEYLISKI